MIYLYIKFDKQAFKIIFLYNKIQIMFSNKIISKTELIWDYSKLSRLIPINNRDLW